MKLKFKIHIDEDQSSNVHDIATESPNMYQYEQAHAFSKKR